MPKEVKVEKHNIFICEACGKREEILAGKKHEWLIFTESKQTGLRLLEKLQSTQRYESFHIPNKVTVYCCSKKCTRKHLIDSLELFMAEITPALHKPQRGLSNL